LLAHLFFLSRPHPSSLPIPWEKNVIFFPFSASAQMHPLTNIPEPLEGVLTSVWFPKHTGAQFEAGEVVRVASCVLLSDCSRSRSLSSFSSRNPDLSLPSLPPSLSLSPLAPTPAPPQVEVIVGFRNTGPTPANVSFVAGSLNSAADFSTHFQNFTALRPAGPVVSLAPDGGDAAVSYRFQLAPNLPEYAFQVALTAFLDVDGETIGEGANRITIPAVRAHTFFNRTVDVVEPSRAVDWQLLQMVLTLLAVGGAVGWVGVQVARGGAAASADDRKRSGKRRGSSSAASVPASSSAASKPAATAAAAASSEWLKGTNIGGKSKKKA